MNDAGSKERLTAEDVRRAFDLEPHPEGGFYRETWRAAQSIPVHALDPGFGGPRPHGTAIFYLLVDGTFSELHRLRADEVWHFYLGDPVEQLRLYPDGSGEVVCLGSDLASGERLQDVVPGGVWQGTRIAQDARCGWSLLGTTMAPGFDFADYVAGVRDDLVAHYPAFRELIVALTRT